MMRRLFPRLSNKMSKMIIQTSSRLSRKKMFKFRLISKSMTLIDSELISSHNL
jgi:hypothetical protein